ncbi:MAG TPA: hypothetical protein VGF45_23380 [Polyangia bacterium]
MTDTLSRSGLYIALRWLAAAGLAVTTLAGGCNSSPQSEAVAPSVAVGVVGRGGAPGAVPDGGFGGGPGTGVVIPGGTGGGQTPTGTGGLPGGGMVPSGLDPDEPRPPAPDAAAPTPTIDAGREVMTAPADATPETAPVMRGCADGQPPPPTLADWSIGHPGGSPLTRVFFDEHVAVYNDSDVDAAATAWLHGFASRAFQYVKATYDPRAKFGGNCLYLFVHDARGAASASNYFDGFSGFRNSLDVGGTGWSQQTFRDVLLHQLANLVEGANNGVHESPAFVVWGNSKWAEFFKYDLLMALGMREEANLAYNKFIATVDSFPRADTHWFRDWFFPLWRDHGKAAVLMKFFGLVSQHFPKQAENGGRNMIYSRRMNLGEYVHFTSAAAGRNLSALATTAFGTTFTAQFNQARADFPALTY